MFIGIGMLMGTSTIDPATLPAIPNSIITEGGDQIITEDGNRIIEE